MTDIDWPLGFLRLNDGTYFKRETIRGTHNKRLYYAYRSNKTGFLHKFDYDQVNLWHMESAIEAVSEILVND